MIFSMEMYKLNNYISRINCISFLFNLFLDASIDIHIQIEIPSYLSHCQTTLCLLT